MVKRLVYWLVVGTAAASSLVWAAHSRDMRRAYERIRGKRKVIPSPYD